MPGTLGLYREMMAGLSRYEWRRDPGDSRLDPVMPEDPAPVHAVEESWRRAQGKTREPVFLQSWEYLTARCGAVVRVYLPLTFKEDDPDACPKCLGAMERVEPTPRDRRWYERPYDRGEPQPVADELLDHLEGREE